tara:strand:+ start:418 stop:741 length:324 start_codon:yes stop_codon:yes gene_type:complete
MINYESIAFTDDDIAHITKQGWILLKHPPKPVATYDRGLYKVYDMATHYKIIGKNNGVRLYHQYWGGITMKANISLALSQALGYKILQKEIKFEFENRERNPQYKEA